MHTPQITALIVVLQAYYLYFWVHHNSPVKTSKSVATLFVLAISVFFAKSRGPSKWFFATNIWVVNGWQTRNCCFHRIHAVWKPEFPYSIHQNKIWTPFTASECPLQQSPISQFLLDSIPVKCTRYCTAIQLAKNIGELRWFAKQTTNFLNRRQSLK